ncbi:transposase, partial [Bacteroides sp. An269]|uniref:transposase n=1 Tax=Bacteroides sp. An269 TaxID=1965613 RepID=UPI001F14BF59
EWVDGTKIRQIFLPPYSPNLNLIERLWKFLRKKVINSVCLIRKPFLFDYNVDIHLFQLRQIQHDKGYNLTALALTANCVRRGA